MPKPTYSDLEKKLVNIYAEGMSPAQKYRVRLLRAKLLDALAATNDNLPADTDRSAAVFDSIVRAYQEIVFAIACSGEVAPAPEVDELAPAVVLQRAWEKTPDDDRDAFHAKNERNPLAVLRRGWRRASPADRAKFLEEAK